MSEQSNTDVRINLAAVGDETAEYLDQQAPKIDYANLAVRKNLSKNQKFIAYTVKLPADQLAALQSIWLELKHLYGANSPDKSGMIQQAITDWLKRWDGPEKQQLLQDLLEIRQDTRRRQYKK
ncbi:MAG TPA: hypothetical protein V6C97_29910 [Oculatellaceae cyanobacterium]